MEFPTMVSQVRGASPSANQSMRDHGKMFTRPKLELCHTFACIAPSSYSSILAKLYTTSRNGLHVFSLCLTMLDLFLKWS